MGAGYTKERFEVLDIFRGLFASMVVFFHLSPFTDTPILNNSLVYHSDLFVDFFFVLSGFVIAYSYDSIKTGGDFTRFCKKRFFRLYPLHITILLVFVLIELAKQFLSPYVHVNQLNNENNNLFTFASSVLMLNSVKLPGVHDVSWNIPSWSISAEMISYLFFGLIMVFIHKTGIYRQRNLLYLIIVFAALSFIYRITGSGRLNYSYDYGFLRGIAGFFTGTLCLSAYRASKENLKKLPAVFFHFSELICVLLIVFLVYQGESLKEKGFIFEILFFAAIFIFAFERGMLSRLLKKSDFLHKMGKYSYSIYLTHALFISLFNVLFIRILKFSPADYSYLFVLNYLIIFFASSWTYKHIEQRFMLKKRRSKETQTSVWIAPE